MLLLSTSLIRINIKRNSHPNIVNSFGKNFNVESDLERMSSMPLSHEDQINLLKDILNDHQIDCCGSVSELEQLERLVKSLLNNRELNHEIKDLLEQIYSYSQNGKNSPDLSQHIEAYQPQLNEWVETIDQFR